MTSVLDGMTRDILSRKEAKAAQLTPVGMEAPRLPPVTVGMFPNDDANQTIAEAARDLDRIISHLIEQRDAMLAMVGQEAQLSVDSGDTVKEVERKADEKFSERIARLKAEAQASVHDVPVEPAPAVDDQGTTGWECPDHAAENLRKMTARNGREYMLCRTCMKFEK